MSSTEVNQQSSPVRSREEIARARQRRQTRTFAGVFVAVLLIGFVAFGNWQQWWTIGGGPAAAEPCPVQSFTKPELANITVVNATERSGLAAAVAKELKKRSFTVLSVGTETPEKPLNAVVEVRYGSGGELAARTVARQFPGKVVMVAEDSETEAVQVVIGNRYKAMVTAKKGAAAIELKPEPRNCFTPAPPTTRTTESTDANDA